MTTINRKKSTVILFLLAFVAFGVAAYNPPDGKKLQITNAGDTLYKNLQVLPKDISKDSLDNVMHNFTSSLGVKCMFCHVHEGDDFKKGWKWESDDKPEKNTARYMLKMTKEINATYFNFDNSAQPDTINVVNCVTCHRGIPHPTAEDIADQMKILFPERQQGPPPSSKNSPAQKK